MTESEEQQFCLRWNNFQANITSQFETLRDDEDFTDVTIACDGQRLQAHRVVLSACSPFFKELFKTNPCTHPIIFMKDVEARHIVALMEFMYAGEVNVAQAHLSTFLKTAESLKIRGLTDTSTDSDPQRVEENTLYLNPQPSKNFSAHFKNKFKGQILSTSTVTSSQDIPKLCVNGVPNVSSQSSPPPKRQCKSESELLRLRKEELMTVNPFAIQNEVRTHLDLSKSGLKPKVELPDYLSDDENDNENVDNVTNFFGTNDVTELPGEMDMIPQAPEFDNIKESSPDLVSHQGNDSRRKLHSLDPRPCEECGKVYSNLSNLRQHMKLIHYPTFVSCHLCKKPFKTDLYLRRHIISSHDSFNSGVVNPTGLSDCAYSSSNSCNQFANNKYQIFNKSPFGVKYKLKNT